LFGSSTVGRSTPKGPHGQRSPSYPETH